MPNHVHVVVSQEAGWTIGEVIHSWKSYTAHEILRRFGRAPNPFWQRDYFDRLVRNIDHFKSCNRYIAGNPIKARLAEGQFQLYLSDSARELEGSGGVPPPAEP